MLSLAISLSTAAYAVIDGALTLGGFVLANVYMLQILRQHVAAAQSQPCPPETLSTEEIFRDVTRQLNATAEMLTTPQIAALIPPDRTATQVKSHLRRCLTQKVPPRWWKTGNKKPRANTKRASRSGAHTSVARLLKAADKPPPADPQSCA